MKRKIIFFVMLVAVAGLATMQSCTKDSPTLIEEYLAPVPAAPSPAIEAVIPFTGANQAINLTWEGTATNAIKWDVYFGDSDEPDMVAEGVASNAYTAHVNAGGTYYWQVYTIDANGVETYSPLWDFQVNSMPSVAGTPVPADNAIGTNPSPVMTWAATDPEDDDLTYDLYLGITATPGPVAAGLTSATYTPATALTQNTMYYWKVVTHDPYGGVSTSPVWKFTTGALPVMKFVGSYNVAENSVQNGAYAYTMEFAKVDNTTILADNWWDSGWAAKFVLDFTKNTIVMTPFTFVSGSSTYICTGSGKITQATGQIILVYSVTKNGVLLENGTDTFTLAGKGLSPERTSNKMPKL